MEQVVPESTASSTIGTESKGGKVQRPSDPQICPENLCVYAQYTHPWHSQPPTSHNIHNIFHDHCDSCFSQAEPLPLCDFCRHLRLRHVLVCLQDELGDGNLEFELPDTDSNPISRILSTKGCQLCDMMASVVRAHLTIKDLDEEFGTDGLYLCDNNLTKGLRLDIRYNKFAMRLETDEKFIFDAVSSPLGSSIPVASLPFPRAAGSIDWSPVRERIGRCSHGTSSTRNSEPPEIPSGFRLIDVDNRRLVSDFPPASKLGSDISFVALSYVWGKSPPSEDNALLDCNETLLSAAGGLKQGSIPRVVEDAITACQHLRQHFLWVDRFCIKQDGDVLERQVQIDAMGDIYSSAEFVIVHACGASIDDPIPGVSTEREVFQTRKSILGLELVSVYPDIKNIMYQSLWNHRGWTYQEYVLCPRRLIFTSQELWFECGCENESQRYWREHYPESIMPRKVEGGLLGMEIIAGPREDSFDCFERHLTQYSRRSLSQVSDTLNALKGISNVLYSGHLSIYGLPEADFDQALLWTTTATQLPPISGGGDFPSWSWASAGSNILFDAQSQHGTFQGHLVHWRYKGSNGVVNDVKSNEVKSPEAYPMEGLAFLLAAWWKGCLESPISDSVKHAPAPTCCGRDSEQRCWIEQLCEHLNRDEHCEQCESYISVRWPSIGHIWDNVRQSAERAGIHDIKYGSCMADLSWTENMPAGVLLTRAQTARFNVSRQETLWSKRWSFVNAEGIEVGIVTSDTEPLKACLVGDIAECIGVSLTKMNYNPSRFQPSVLVPGVSVLIIHRSEGSSFARRIGVGKIILWDWAEAEREFKDVALK